MVKHTVIAEYIYGWKGRAYIAIRKQFSALCRNTAYYQLSGERNTVITENIFIGILTCSTEISGQTVLIICASVQSVVVHVSASGLSD